MKPRWPERPHISFFDEPFWWQFALAPDLSEAKDHLETPCLPTADLDSGPAWLWLFANGSAAPLRKAVDDLCPTICSDGFEGRPEILRSPPAVLNSLPLMIGWQYDSRIATYGTIACRQLPEPNYRLGSRAINPALASSSLSGSSAFPEILSQSSSEVHLEILRTQTEETQSHGAAVLAVNGLESYSVIEVWSVPLFSVDSKSLQIRRGRSGDTGVRQWS
jgi:hypothetical protein